MKKLLFSIILISNLTSDNGFSSENRFHYKPSKTTDSISGLLFKGTLLFGAASIFLGEPEKSLILSAGVGLVAGITMSGYTLTPNLMKDLDDKGFTQKYKRFKALSKALSSGTSVNDKTFQKQITDRFSCDWCTTDEERSRKFSKAFITLDNLAKKLVKEKVFTISSSSKIFEQHIVNKTISEVLEEDDTTTNREFMREILAYALTFHHIQKNK